MLVAVAVATRIAGGGGGVNVKVSPVPVWITVPSSVSVQSKVTVWGTPGLLAVALRVIVPAPWLPELPSCTVGGASLTTIDVLAEVVLVPSDTETWIG